MTIYNKRNQFRNHRAPLTPRGGDRPRARVAPRVNHPKPRQCHPEPKTSSVEPVVETKTANWILQRKIPFGGTRTLVMALALLAALGGGLSAAFLNTRSHQEGHDGGRAVVESRTTEAEGRESGVQSESDVVAADTAVDDVALDDVVHDAEAGSGEVAMADHEIRDLAAFTYVDDETARTGAERSALGILLDAVQELEKN